MSTVKRAKRSRKIAENKVLASRIMEWANSFGHTSDPYVLYLAEGVLKRRNLPLLAEIDPLEHLPARAATTQSRRISIIRTLTVLRNTLVFAPVALTWSAVSHATEGFSKYVDQNPDNVANFLQFWQNGYGYLANEWKIGTVANLDFLIIMGVIFLTLYISLSNNQLRDRALNIDETFKRDRLALALEVKEFLDGKRRITNVTMNQSLAKSIQNLQNATLELDNTVVALNKKVSRVEKELM